MVRVHGLLGNFEHYSLRNEISCQWASYFWSTPPVPYSLYIIVIILAPTEESENSLQLTELPENLI